MNSLRAPLQLTSPALGRCLRCGGATALLLASAIFGRAVSAEAQTPELPAPVVIGAPVKGEQTDLTPVTVKGQTPAKSDIAPVTIGATAAGKSAIAPVKVGGVAALDGAGLAAVNASSLRVPLLLKSVTAGTAKVEELLRSGALKTEDLVWAVHHPRLWQQTASDGAATSSTIQVYDAFLARFDEEVAGAVSWEDSAHWALAFELLRRDDARAVPLLKSLIAAGQAQFDQQKPLPWFYEPSVMHLAEWYLAKRHGREGLELLDGAAALSKNPVYRADWLLLSARIATQMGDREKASGYYGQVAQWGQGWFTGLVTIDRVENLMNDNQFVQAQQEVEAALQTQKSLRVPSIPAQIALLSRFGALRYIAGDFPTARATLRQVIELYDALPLSSRVNGIATDYGVSKAYLQDIEQWEQTPIVSNGSIYLILRPVETQEEANAWEQKSLYERAVVRGPSSTIVQSWIRGTPLKKLLVLSSFRAAPMRVTSDNPLLQLQVSDRGQPEDWITSAPKDVWIEIPPQALESGQTFEASLTVTSPQFPKFSMRVPVHIEVQ